MVCVLSFTQLSQVLTLSRRRLLSYRNQSIDLLCKSVDWFLYDNDLRRERVNASLVPSLVTLLFNDAKSLLNQ